LALDVAVPGRVSSRLRGVVAEWAGPTTPDEALLSLEANKAEKMSQGFNKAQSFLGLNISRLHYQRNGVFLWSFFRSQG